MVTWLVDNWEFIAPLAAVVLASTAQLLTRHPDVARGALRWVLLAIDALSLITSPGSSAGRGRLRGMGRAKLPMLQMSPVADDQVLRDRAHRVTR